MNPTTAQIAIANHIAAGKAVVVEEVNQSLMYVGYCSPECTGFSDPKWRIERIQTSSGIQTIFLAGGTSAMVHKWSDRATLTYKPTTNWE